MSVLLRSTGVELRSAQDQQFLEVLHVPEAAEGGRLDFDYGSLLLEKCQAIIEPAPQCGGPIIRKTLDLVSEGDVEDVSVVIGMPVTERHGQCVTPSRVLRR
ncbi:hypothetical protein [Mesorhizobium cantuariense]|uniref:Uncharacterized protein n=1 Tax=Mesorhizobium cantuariense TaxID=1300275 RepID=A0ABV7MX22_9HYPH